MNNGNGKITDPQALVSGVVAVLLVIGALALAILGRDVPQWLVAALTLAIGFYFGNSTSNKQFRRDDAQRIQQALYETLPPHTKLDQLNEEMKTQRKEKR